MNTKIEQGSNYVVDNENRFFNAQEAKEVSQHSVLARIQLYVCGNSYQQQAPYTAAVQTSQIEMKGCFAFITYDQPL